MRIQHNILAMNSYRNYSNNTSALGKNLEKLSSGYKINRAGDDAAGLAISEKMRAQIKGLDAAQKNVKDAVSFVKTAEGAMQEIQDMLTRMKYLATQSANGTYDEAVDRNNLQMEVDELLKEIDRISESANFNGIHMLNGAKGNETNPTSASAATIAADQPVAAALQKDESTAKSGETVELQIDWKNDKASNLDFSTSGTSKLSELYLNPADLTGSTVTIGWNNTQYTVTLSSSEDDSDTVLKISGETTLNDIINGIQTKLQAQLTAGADEAKKGQTTFTEFTGLKLTGADDGVITAKVDMVTWSEPSGTDTDTDTKTPAVPKDTEIKMDFSGINGKLVEGDKVKIGDTWYVFKKPADDASSSQGTDQSQQPALALSGQGTEASPYEVDPGETLDDALNALAQAINAAGGDISASYANGKLTIKAEKDMTKEEFEAATDIKFDTSNKAVGEALEKAWNDAVKEALGGDKYSITMQIGDSSSEKLTLEILNMNTASLGIDTLKDDGIKTQTNANEAIDIIKKAINTVSSTRGQLGAYQNRLEHTANNLSVMAENIQDAESTIRDTDVADEMMGYVKNNILVQSAQAMLAQANQVPQGVLQLLG